MHIVELQINDVLDAIGETAFAVALLCGRGLTERDGCQSSDRDGNHPFHLSPPPTPFLRNRAAPRRARNLIGECYGSGSEKLKHRDGGDFAKWLRAVTTMGLHGKGLRATCNTHTKPVD